MSSVCYPSKSVFPAQDVSDDTHQELSASNWAFSRFCLLSMRVSGEKREERRVTRRRGRSSEKNLIRTAMVPTAAPNEPVLAGITMLVTDTSSTTGVRFLPSLIPYSLSSCCLFLLFFIPAFLTSFLPIFLYSLSLSLSLPKR